MLWERGVREITGLARLRFLATMSLPELMEVQWNNSKRFLWGKSKFSFSFFFFIPSRLKYRFPSFFRYCQPVKLSVSFFFFLCQPVIVVVFTPNAWLMVEVVVLGNEWCFWQLGRVWRYFIRNSSVSVSPKKVKKKPFEVFGFWLRHIRWLKRINFD